MLEVFFETTRVIISDNQVLKSSNKKTGRVCTWSTKEANGLWYFNAKQGHNQVLKSSKTNTSQRFYVTHSKGYVLRRRRKKVQNRTFFPVGNAVWSRWSKWTNCYSRWPVPGRRRRPRWRNPKNSWRGVVKNLERCETTNSELRYTWMMFFSVLLR